MNAAVYLDRATKWARELENDEAERLGIPVHEARKIVARRIRVAPGTLENLRKGRLKGVAAHVYAFLRQEAAKQIVEELKEHLHERQVLVGTGAHPDSGEVRAVDASIETLREALGLRDSA